MTSTAQLPALLPALPEMILAGGAMVLLMLGAYRGERSSPVVALGGIMILVAAMFAIVWLPGGKTVTFGGSFILDDFARFLKLLAFGGSAVAILMSQTYFENEKQNRFEYPILVLLATAGMGMMISAGDLIALYLGLELMSLSLYVLAAGNRDSERSTEAGLKYFVLGGLSSGMLLYGCSLIYGYTGSVAFGAIAQAASQGGIGLMFGLVFLFAGLCFKVSAVPFHMWTPDVYEGAPTPMSSSSPSPRWCSVRSPPSDRRTSSD
jgi:NADH-quinone oxidoreductase subunit N